MKLEFTQSDWFDVRKREFFAFRANRSLAIELQRKAELEGKDISTLIRETLAKSLEVQNA